MKMYLYKKSLITFVACAVFVSALPVFTFAKTDQPKQSYDAVQVGSTPVFRVTNTGRKDEPVNIELDLYSNRSTVFTPFVWDNQVIQPGSSQTYNMGSLPLTPAGSPYHVALRIFSSRHLRLIKEINPIATFTVVHGGCFGPYCH